MSIEIAAMEQALKQVVSACGLDVQPTISQDLDLIGNALRESLSAGEKAEAELEEAKAEINELAPWSCVDCGPNIKIDEAGCCAMCGRDAAMKGDE